MMGMARKPTADELRESDRYLPARVHVEAYQDIYTGNILFITHDTDEVLDQYIKVVDAGGYVVAVRNKRNLPRVGRLFGAIVALVAPQLGIPRPVAQALTGAAGSDVQKLANIREAFREAKKREAGAVRRGARMLVEELGWAQAKELIDLWDESEVDHEEFLSELESLSPPPSSED